MLEFSSLYHYNVHSYLQWGLLRPPWRIQSIRPYGNPSLTDVLEYNPVQLHGYAIRIAQTGGLLLAMRAKWQTAALQLCVLLNMKFHHFHTPETNFARSWWPCGLRRGSAAARLLGLRVRIQPGTWISVFCECCVCVCVCVCVWSGRSLCDGLITSPEESYRVWRVWVWSRNLRRRPRPITAVEA